MATNEACSVQKAALIKCYISNENTAAYKFLLENKKLDRILPVNSLDKAYETLHFVFLNCMILHHQKEKLELKLKIYSLPG